MSGPAKVSAEQPLRRPIKTMEPGIALRAPDPPSDPPQDVETYALEVATKSLISLGAATSPRATQASIGLSEIGHICERRVAFRLAKTPPSNLTDPIRALVGTGFHHAMAEMFKRLDSGSGRFLVEHHVRYRGIPGTLDLFDRHAHTVVDWKTVLKAKLAHLRSNGPQTSYVVQQHGYGAALAQDGEDVRYVSLAFIPIDGTLDEAWMWREPFDPTIANKAIDRVNALHELEPSRVPKTPSELCKWCPYYQNTTVPMDRSCNGKADTQ